MGKKLKYFLDHPQIKRGKSYGNGNSPKIGSASSSDSKSSSKTGEHSQEDSVGAPTPNYDPKGN